MSDFDDLNDDRKADLVNAVENIVQDTHNKAIGDCHNLILQYDGEWVSELEKKLVELYKH